MIFWCIMLFLLGIAAFVDTLFNCGEIFRKINATLFFSISLALLVRTTSKKKIAKVEGYEKRIAELERKVAALDRPPANR